MTKKASIIIPCYNTGKTIGRTLRAFCRQAVPAEDYEIIVVDDCSVDNTAAEIGKEAAVASQVIFLQNTANSGPALSRNRALDIACGEIVIFSDGDIIPCDNYLQLHLKGHKRYPEDRYVVLGAAAMPEDMEITPLMYLGNVVSAMSRAKNIGDDPYDWLHFSTLNVSLKRRFLDDVRFDSSFRRKQQSDTELAGFEDTELAQRLAKKGMKLVFNPEIRAFHYHFRTPDQYIDKVRGYGKKFAVWISLCDPAESEELNRRMNFLLDFRHPLSFANFKECVRRLVVNDLTFPSLRAAARFFESRNERLSLFLYQKMYKYLFLKGFHSQEPVSRRHQS